MAQDIAIEDEDAAAAEDGLPRWDLKRGQDIDATLVVIDQLGLGSRYETYRAWDRSLFCEAAVKVIRPHRVSDDRALEGFEREVAIGTRMNHPYVVRFLRWNAGPPRPYLVMEYIGARTLGAHLDQIGAVSIPETCLLGVRMAAALHHMHTTRVLHLDVKPYNITMGDPPKLLDLSLARTFAGRLKMRHTVGTRQYMAPEQCLRGEVTPQTDLFSLAATLYEGVSATLPYPDGDPNAEERSERYPQMEIDALPLSQCADVPAGLEAVIMACLQRDPRRRPHSALDVAQAFQRVLEELGVRELYAWPKGLRVRL